MSQQTANIIAKGVMHSELSKAAYANLKKDMIREEIIEALQDVDITETQAKAFAETWRVVNQFNSLTGASATVFEKIDTGQRYLAVRGTETWDPRDMLVNGLLTIGAPAKANPQVIALTAQVKEWLKDGTLPPNFDISGHSLGGYIAIVLKEAFSENISHAYVYNTPGQWGILGDVAEFIGSILGVSNTSDPTVTIYTTAGKDFSPISDLGLPAGAITVYVLTDNSWSHSIVTLSDALKAWQDGTGSGILIKTVNADKSIRLEAPLKNKGSNVTIIYADNSIRNETYDKDGELISSNYSGASNKENGGWTNTFTESGISFTVRYDGNGNKIGESTNNSAIQSLLNSGYHYVNGILYDPSNLINYDVKLWGNIPGQATNLIYAVAKDSAHLEVVWMNRALREQVARC